MSDDLERALIDELAQVLYDADEARMVAARAGFPRSRMPAFRTSLVFWSKVVEDLGHGIIPDGVRRLAESARNAYQHNPVFADVLSKLGTGGGASAVEAWDLAISYAGEDVELARQINSSLKDEFRVFFVPDEQDFMLGNRLSTVLPKVYGLDARYVLVLSTAAYCRKHWTREEFEAAREREGRLLVVDLGELPPDMPSDLVYIQASLANLVGLVDVLRKKLRP